MERETSGSGGPRERERERERGVRVRAAGMELEGERVGRGESRTEGIGQGRYKVDLREEECKKWRERRKREIVTPRGGNNVYYRYKIKRNV